MELAIQCAGGNVVGDVAELTEALYNLASNALQARPRNSTGAHHEHVESVSGGGTTMTIWLPASPKR